MFTSTRNFTRKQCEIYIDQYTMQIDSLMQNKKNVWELMGFINRNEIIAFGCPFLFQLTGDSKESSIYRCYIQPPKLTLEDLTVYFDDGTNIKYKANYKRHYISYITKLFKLLLGNDHGLDPMDVFNVEAKILTAMGCETIKYDSPDYYNKLTGKEALKYNFDWSEFSKALGFKKEPPFFVTASLNYLQCCSDMLMAEWNTNEWRTYWLYIFIKQISRFSSETRYLYYEFNDQFEEGESADIPQHLFAIFPMSLTFNTFLSNEYIERFHIPENEKYVEAMAYDLRSVFIRKIKRNKWLSPSTKRHAVKKLEAIKLIIGTPRILREDPLLNYDPHDLWGNLLKITSWRSNQLLSLEGKPLVDIPLIDWSETPPMFISKQAYTVNAYYIPTENSIFVPSAYMQAPFIDLNERGLEYNLAYIGFTIAHELSHCLDNTGSKYDENGNLHDWWTPRDKLIFQRKEKDILKHYKTFAAYDNIIFDAEDSLGEDMADISGIAICEEYLRDFQEVHADIVPVRILSFRAFFFYFAMQMRQKISKRSIAAQLRTNPHPLDKYRVNVPLSRLSIFKLIHNLKKNDKMSWSKYDPIW